MNYHILGRLPDDIIEEFKKEILKNKNSEKNYFWIQFNESLENLFLSLFKFMPLKIQFNPETQKNVQKVFFSDPGHGFRIHKDGKKCRSALNIAVSSNQSDWVRWYNEDLINKLSNTTVSINSGGGRSRDTDIPNYENVSYEDELKVTSGTVYILNIDKFHSFKCNGPEPRIVIQTKFENFPDLEELYKKITPSIFKRLEI